MIEYGKYHILEGIYPHIGLHIGLLADGNIHKRKYVHEVLVNCLFKLAQEKVWLGELTVPP